MHLCHFQVLVEFDFAAERDDHSSVFKCEATSPSIPHAPVIKQELLQVYCKSAVILLMIKFHNMKKKNASFTLFIYFFQSMKLYETV